MCRKRVPDGRCSNWKTPSAELSSGARNQHVVAFSRTEVCPTRDVRSRRADVLEVLVLVPAFLTSRLDYCNAGLYSVLATRVSAAGTTPSCGPTY